MKPSEVKSILLLRFSSMGDLILMSTLIDHIREQLPQAKITLVTRDDLKSIYQHHSGIHEILSIKRSNGFRGLWNLMKTLRTRSWDILYDAHGSLRSIFLRIFVPARVKLVIHKRTLQRLFLIILKKNVLPFHYFKDQYCFPLYKFLGQSMVPKPTRIVRSQEQKKRIDELWNFPSDKRVIGLVPSAQWPEKRWPVTHFEALMKHLHRDFDLALFGGPEDDFCEQLAQSIPAQPRRHRDTSSIASAGPERDSVVINFQGRLSLLETFEALSRCDLVVANDTGLMHAAEAVQTDVIALLGPTGEEFGFVPYRPQSDFLTNDLWCRPCSKNGQGFCIRFGQRKCLTGLQVSDVAHGVYNYFNKEAARASSP